MTDTAPQAGAEDGTRDHYTEHPARWVAACCDRGLRHDRNEDATAVGAAADPGSWAVLVVCDGVSSSRGSDVAALAGARAGRDLLVQRAASGAGAEPALVEAAARANRAVIEHTAPDSDNAASCTFAAAVLDGDVVSYANVGDSRVYWLPDLDQPEPALELSLDDSVAQFRISAGVPREQAEHGPQAHAITKWLGRDSSDAVPRTGSLAVSAAGWLMACTDGLWNYCSEAVGLQVLLDDLGGRTAAPLALAEALVGWANRQGGKDNVSVALARHRGSVPTPR